MDNLNFHHNAAVLNDIYNHGHRLFFREPYWAVNGAIQYVFNTILTRLLMYYNKITTMEEFNDKFCVKIAKTCHLN